MHPKLKNVPHLEPEKLTDEQKALLDECLGGPPSKPFPKLINPKTYFKRMRRPTEKGLLMIVGSPSGFGKTFSIRNIPQSEMVYFDFDSKECVSYLPVATPENDPYDALTVTVNLLDASERIIVKEGKEIKIPTLAGLIKRFSLGEALHNKYLEIKEAQPHRKYFVFDTVNSYLSEASAQAMSKNSRANGNLWSSFLDMGIDLQQLFSKFRNGTYYEDCIIIMLHTQVNTQTGQESLLINGKMYEKYKPETYVNNMFRANYDELTSSYVFQHGKGFYKALIGIPKEFPNDCMLAIKMIRDVKNAEKILAEYTKEESGDQSS